MIKDIIMHEKRTQLFLETGVSLSKRQGFAGDDSGNGLLGFGLFVQLRCNPRNGHRADHVLQQGREYLQKEVFHQSPLKEKALASAKAQSARRGRHAGVGVCNCFR